MIEYEPQDNPADDVGDQHTNDPAHDLVFRSHSIT